MKYSQLEKEGLACIFGVMRFNSYVYGRTFSLKLANYEYTFEFRPTHQHANADALSRVPLGDKPSSVLVPAEMVLLTEMLESAPVTAVQIANRTKKDPILSKLIRCIREGWPNRVEDDFDPKTRTDSHFK